jgi:RNA polymerase sigma-70 factor (ECF subfamily)
MRDLEDQILVQRALQSDPESFGELCRRYYDSLVAAAYSILPDRHLAEDAAQEALAAACRDLAKLKKPERFGPWIGAICRNVAKDMLRQLRKQQEPVETNAGNEPDCREDEREAILDQALRQLPQHLREVIFLRFYNEMSYEQMAKVLGATQQVIDGRLRRAKKKIAAYLMKKGFRKQ